jgi:hypothetical protein
MLMQRSYDPQEEIPVQHHIPTKHQLPLFQKQLTWNEFPKATRMQICHLLAAVCLAAIDNQPTTAKERNHEPRINSNVPS